MTTKMIDIYKQDTFLYFAYSANLLTFRVKMFNPTAEFVSIARLDNYRLDFIKYSKFWGGPTATIVPTANAHTWGVIWRLHKDDKISLDDQKGVDIKTFFVKFVTVHTPHMGDFICRSYMKKVYPLPRGDNDSIPVERWPSRTYKEVLIMGARQHGLPEHYIKFLRRLKHNGDDGGWFTGLLLRRYANNKVCECRVPGRIPREPLKKTLTWSAKVKKSKG
ncbi:gamma-glutamylcyclotransferase-like [Anticarsia gemmatalis]|uniref:gamma-glutamylcyclotransferase-like n=1 Tax=Anticarsia gemmatalis TaxID=129554 RepID=UPI003F7754F6